MRLLTARTGEKEEDIVMTIGPEVDGGRRSVETLFMGENGQNAADTWSTEVRDPDKDLTDAGVLGAGASDETEVPAEEDSDGTPWWIWLLVGGGVLILGGVAVGFVVWRMNGKKDNILMTEFMTFEELEVNELNDLSTQNFGKTEECLL